MGLDAVAANADHHGSEVREVLVAVPEGAGLGCATGGEVLGIEEQYDVALILVFAQGDADTILIW